MSNKAYEKLGLTEKDVVDLQNWLFPMANETRSISEMIVKTVDHFDNSTTLYYALYILGNQMGQAQIKEQLGLAHILNPEEI